MAIDFEQACKTEEDGRLILTWRNDPETRRVSRHHDPMTWEAFWDQYRQGYFRCEDLPPLFVLSQGRRTGLVGFSPWEENHKTGDRCVEIHINLAPEARGRGLGMQALTAAKARAFRQGVDSIGAHIVEGNEASIRAFAKAGFTLLGSRTENGEGTACIYTYEAAKDRTASLPPAIPWRGRKISRMVLGTAQLGMPYGIANAAGPPSPAEAKNLVEAAWRGGITHFDTAQVYGQSEQILGGVFACLDMSEKAEVITKLAPGTDLGDAEAVMASLETSCHRLGMTRVFCVMIHDPGVLTDPPNSDLDTLTKIKEAGLAEFGGISVYTPAQALQALAHPAIDVVQLPCNAWDQRVLRAHVLDEARRCGKLCMVRSVYLQGLLTLPPDSISRQLPEAAQAAVRWAALAEEAHLKKTELAMRFANSLDVPLVIGCESASQIAENLALLNHPGLSADAGKEIYAAMEPLIDEQILDPSRWRPA